MADAVAEARQIVAMYDDGIKRNPTITRDAFYRICIALIAEHERAERLHDAYLYLQQRLESIGYHGWAHDKDYAIRAQGDDHE